MSNIKQEHKKSHSIYDNHPDIVQIPDQNSISSSGLGSSLNELGYNKIHNT
mgnify:CR=1 FL=1